MKQRKFNKYEKHENRRQNIESAMSGSGMYLFENNSNADLTLPRPTHSGLRKIGPRQQFQADSYFLQMVRSGFLRLIEELQSPESEKAAIMSEQKLILDQPDTVTSSGKVEHVVDNAQPVQKINESDKQPTPDVLINEAPSDDGFMILN
jgi:hypothetical protein